MTATTASPTLMANAIRALAMDAVQAANSGHPGSITTVHADSARLAFEQLTLLVKESDGRWELPGGGGDFRVYADPPVGRVGSGGGTVWAGTRP